MPDRSYISKVRLPGPNGNDGGLYYIKDEEARELIEQLAGATIFLGVTTTELYDGDTEHSSIVINGETIEVPIGGMAIYDDKEFIWNGSQWFQFGDLSTLGSLAYQNVVHLQKGTGTQVLGENTTFTVPSTTVNLGSSTTDDVLGSGTTFQMVQPTITVTPTTTYLQAVATGAAVGADGTASVVTGYSAPTMMQFVKSVTAESNKKLVTTSIQQVSGTETVSKVLQSASKLVTTSLQGVSSVGSASSWTFTMGSGTDDSETLFISGNNSTVPTLTPMTTLATGSVASNGSGSSIVTEVSISDKTVAKAGNSVTVATGSTDALGTGDAIVTDISIGEQQEAIVSLGTASTETVLTGVKVTSQPRVNLSTGATAGKGVVSVATGITSATATDGEVLIDTLDSVQAITELGSASLQSVNVEVGTNDRVKVAEYDDLDAYAAMS